MYVMYYRNTDKEKQKKTDKKQRVKYKKEIVQRFIKKGVPHEF